MQVDAPRVAQTQEEDEILCKEAIRVLEGEDREQFVELQDQLQVRIASPLVSSLALVHDALV
eukprot:757047-Hanusia_phi.AAC.1